MPIIGGGGTQIWIGQEGVQLTPWNLYPLLTVNLAKKKLPIFRDSY